MPTEKRDRQAEITVRANSLWLAEGCPEGRALSHWLLAEELVSGEAARDEMRAHEIEMRIAQEIQSRLFPDRSPVVKGWELAGRSIPLEEVGGDYFDFVRLADGAMCALSSVYDRVHW